MIVSWSFGKVRVLYVEVLEREDDEQPDSSALEVYNERAAADGAAARVPALDLSRVRMPPLGFTLPDARRPGRGA